MQCGLKKYNESTKTRHLHPHLADKTGAFLSGLNNSNHLFDKHEKSKEQQLWHKLSLTKQATQAEKTSHTPAQWQNKMKKNKGELCVRLNTHNLCPPTEGRIRCYGE